MVFSCIYGKKEVASDAALLRNSPEVMFAKSCKWQNKMNFICTFGFFVVTLQRKGLNDPKQYRHSLTLNREAQSVA